MKAMADREGAIRFGDNSEFVLEDIVEELDASGEKVTEAVIFFRNDSVIRGIAIALEQPDTETSEQVVPEDTPEPVRLTVIDPQSVMQLLEQPSELLLEISQPISAD